MYSVVFGLQAGEVAECVGYGIAVAGVVVALVAQQRDGAGQIPGKVFEQIALCAQVAAEVAEEALEVAVVA